MTPSSSPEGHSGELFICFSHLRWNFVYQRPQHLMSRFAERYDVRFFEEPIYGASTAYLDVKVEQGVTVLVPQVPEGHDATFVLKHLLDEYLLHLGKQPTVLWYYTPMSVAFSAHLPRRLVVYDCMDELSAFGCPSENAGQ